MSQLASDLGIGLGKRGHGAQWGMHREAHAGAEGTLVVMSMILARPTVYMNLNGHSVRRLMQGLDVARGQLLILHDHMDLPLGQIRIRARGGSGGNNGVKSVIQQLGSQEFPRIRIGVGRPPGRMDPAQYVLRRFGSGAERDLAGTVKSLAAEVAVYWMRHGIDATMNMYNGRP